MFVSFTKTLKKMSGFRLGFGVRVNKRNAPLLLKKNGRCKRLHLAKHLEQPPKICLRLFIFSL